MLQTMVKIPYVLNCELFNRMEIKNAEELLGEYNDFYQYNLAQYGKMYNNKDAEPDDEDEIIDESKRLELAEHNNKVASDHFASLFGSIDFAESTLVGFRPNWYDLQQILLEEFKSKTHILDSAMNGIAPMLRNVASIMLFAERIVYGLGRLACSSELMESVKEGFELLLEKCNMDDGLRMPEYHKTKKEISKFKRIDHYLDFCEKLFFNQQREY